MSSFLTIKSSVGLEIITIYDDDNFEYKFKLIYPNDFDKEKGEYQFAGEKEVSLLLENLKAIPEEWRNVVIVAPRDFNHKNQIIPVLSWDKRELDNKLLKTWGKKIIFSTTELSTLDYRCLVFQKIS